MPRSPPTPCWAWSSRCRAASAATCSRSSGMPRPRSSIGLNASGRAPAAATIDLFKAKGLTAIPDSRAAELVGPGLRRRLGPAPQAVRHQGLARAARAGDRLRRDRLSRSARSSPPTGAAPSPASRRFPPRPPASFPAAMRPATGSIFRNPGLARSLRAIAQDGRDAFYQGPLADAIVSYSQSVGGLFSPVGFRRAHQQLRRSGLDQLPRLRRLGASAQRPGDRRPPDAQPARAVSTSRAWGRSRPRRFT